MRAEVKMRSLVSLTGIMVAGKPTTDH